MLVSYLSISIPGCICQGGTFSGPLGTYRKMFTLALLIGAKVGGSTDIVVKGVDKKNVMCARDGTGMAVSKEMRTN